MQPAETRSEAEPIHDLVERMAPRIRSVAHAFGATNLRLFGSVARRDDDGGSDIDLLVDLAPDKDLFDLIGLGQSLSEHLGVRVDVVTERLLKPAVLERARAEAVPL